jgi:hypothetical protein
MILINAQHFAVKTSLGRDGTKGVAMKGMAL